MSEPLVRSSRGDAVRRAWADPVLRAKRCAALSRARAGKPIPLAVRLKLAASARLGWADPAVKAARVAAIQAGKDAAKARRRLGLVEPFVDQLEAMFLPDGEELTPESRVQVTAFLIEFRDATRGRAWS